MNHRVHPLTPVLRAWSFIVASIIFAVTTFSDYTFDLIHRLLSNDRTETLQAAGIIGAGVVIAAGASCGGGPPATPSPTSISSFGGVLFGAKSAVPAWTEPKPLMLSSPSMRDFSGWPPCASKPPGAITPALKSAT